jgi:bla regulator protein blaR1
MSPHRMLRRRLEMIESIVRRVPLTRAGWALIALAALALVPVRLVAKETGEETHCLDIGNDAETAYVITNGKSHAMCGNVADVRDAERARGSGGDVIWFRVGDQKWVIRDPEAVAQGRRYFKAITETAQAQSELAMEQARAGMEQARGSVEQANASMEQAAEAMRKAELDAARQQQGQDMQRNREQLEQELQAAQAARERAAADAERQHEVVSQRMRELGERQGELGAKQRELAERMERARNETGRALSEFLEQSIKDGVATRTP